MQDIVSPPPVLDVDFLVEESWIKRKPKLGDHIRVQRIGGLYAHHGIYVSDREVIHFTGKEDDSILDWSKPEVISSDLDYFLKDGILEIKEYSDEEFQDLYSPEQIVTYARACLGDKGYNLVFNNCEHFANVCTLGRFRSNQVERVLLGKLPNEQEDKNMGILSKIGGAIRSLFSGGGSGGGGSRSTTTYEPDKVKVAEIEADAKIRLADMEIKRAEIEADTQIRLANMEADRIEIMKQAKIDMIQFETESQIALEQAKAQGFASMAQTILLLQEKLNEVAEKRLLIIEKGSLQIIKDIENFYDELGDRIVEDNDKYNIEKLPQMLEILEKYEEGSPSHKIYMKRIEEDMVLQAKHYTYQIEAISQRQSQIIDGFLQSKDKILEQTGQITAGMLDTIKNQTLALDVKGANTTDNAIPMLDEKKTLQIGD